MDFRNCLKSTHWKTNDISTFEAAFEPLVAGETNPSKKEHYQIIAEAYAAFWKKDNPRFYEIPSSVIEIAGLPIRITTEVGMSLSGDNLALKLWLNAPRPTRQFRQAIQYITERGRQRWHRSWQASIWDVRRHELLQPVPIPRDFPIGLESQAMAFQHIWESLAKSDEAPF